MQRRLRVLLDVAQAAENAHGFRPSQAAFADRAWGDLWTFAYDVTPSDVAACQPDHSVP